MGNKPGQVLRHHQAPARSRDGEQPGCGSRCAPGHGVAAVGTSDSPALLGLASVCSQSMLVPGLEGKTEIVFLDPSQSQ